MQNSFNADFYVTTATVIPVLYLALTLQGNGIRDLMTRFRKLNQESQFKFLPQVRVVGLLVFVMLALYVIVASLLAENYAIRALADHRAAPGILPFVGGTLVILLIAVGISPVSWFLRAFFGTLNDDRKAAMARRSARLEAESRAEAQPVSAVWQPSGSTAEIDLIYPA